MNRFRRAPEGSSRASRGFSGENTNQQQPQAPSSTSAGPGERSTVSAKSPSFAEPAAASFMQAIIHRQPSSANTTATIPFEREEAFGGRSLAADGISGASAKPTTGFFNKRRSHLGFPRHSNDTPGGPFESLAGGGGAPEKTRGVYSTEAPPSISNTSQPYAPLMPLNPTPNDTASPSARAATGVHPPHPELPTTPRFLRGKSTPLSPSPPRPGKRLLSPMTDCSAAAFEKSFEDDMNGETSEKFIEKNDQVNNDSRHHATMAVGHGRTEGERLGVGHAGAASGVNLVTQGSGYIGGRGGTRTQPCDVPTTRRTSSGLGSIERNPIGKPSSEKERPCTPALNSAPWGHTKAGSRGRISASQPTGSTKSGDGDRATSSPHQLDRIAKEYDPFDDLSAAEDASFAKAAASIRELKHRQLCIRETIARSHSRLLQGDNGVKMMADLDDLSARASNLLVEMKLDAPAPPRSEAPRREASRKDRDEQLQRRQDGGSCQTRQTRASPPLATGQLFHEGSRPPKRGPT
ncbi:unnamed protein product, partial [Ascophyllum nodosum]